MTHDRAAPRLLNMDCREGLKGLADGSVHCVVTSPPYWGLRDYGLGEGQLGLERTPEEYVANLVDIFREVRRVLRDDGVCWLNLGDGYWGGKGQSNFAYVVEHEARETLERTHHNAVGGRGRTRPQDEYHATLKPKDLLMIPARVALALQADGAADPKAMSIIVRMRSALLDSYETWDEVPAPTRREVARLEEEYCQAKAGSWWLRSDIIWAKPNPMPESVTDRPTRSHEYVFMLTKAARYWYDQEAVREPLSESTIRIHSSANVRPQGSGDWKGKRNADRNDGGSATLVNGRQALQDAIDRGGRNLRSVWTIPIEPFSSKALDTDTDHFAVFPQALVRPMILASCPKRTCPTCGAGWVRVVEREATNHRARQDRQTATGGAVTGGVGKNFPDVVRRAVGHRPTCSCPDNDGSLPGLVLDTFAGRGTTLKVAWALGRRSTGFEASSDYHAMGLKWIHGPLWVPGGEAKR